MSGVGLGAGVALAALAAACFDGALALQALESRAAAPGAVGRDLVRVLVRRPRWLAATALALLGWPMQLGALTLAPLAVVQPTLALGLVLLLWLGARRLHEPAGVRELVAVVAIAGGVALLAWAAPDPGQVDAGPRTLLAILGPLAVLAGLPWLRRHHSPGGLLVLAAGAGYAASALTSKLLAGALVAGPDWPASLGWAATSAAVAGLALGDEMAALQRVSAAGVAAGAFVLQTVVPVALAPVLVDEGWGVAASGGLLAVTAGSIVLARSPGVRRVVEDAAAR